MIIVCPLCGSRNYSEFTYKRDAAVKMPALDAEMDPWVEAVYFRKNSAGWNSELWHHEHGCRSWLVVQRNTVTHEIAAVELAHDRVAQAARGSQ